MKMGILFWIAIAVIFALSACNDDSGSVREVTSIPVNAGSALTPTLMRQTETSTNIVQATPSAMTTMPFTSAAVSVTTGPTYTPWDTQLQEGEARRLAAATDSAFQPTPRSIVSFEKYPVSLKFEEFFDSFDMRSGWVMSDKLVSLDGQEVEMEGYIAPPLKPKLDFFVLTQIPLAFCPFCSTDADWPDRIALVYLPDSQVIDNRFPVRIRGRLEVGSSIDYSSGMVSLVRLYAEEIEVLN